MKQSHYAVAFKWPNEELGFYAFHSNEILYCSKAEALEALDYVKSKNTNNSKDYKLYKLKLKEVI